MELYIYDAAMTLIGIIDEIKSLIWTRRYWSCGEFKLLVPLTDRHAELIQNGLIVVRRGSDEAGQISYINISQDQNGLETIEAQGRFLTGWIGQRLVEPVLVMTGPSHTVLQRIVNDNLIRPADARRRIPSLNLADTGALVTEDVTYASEQFANALNECTARAQLAKIGFKIVTDIAAKRHFFVVYKGLDRTSGQRVNPICIFSTDFDNVLTQEFVASHENMASAIYVGGGGAMDEARKWIEVSDDACTGLDRIEEYYDAADLTQTYIKDGVEQTIPVDEYYRLLRARGEQTLAQKVERIAFHSMIDTRAGFAYQRDYDVGDRVTCVNRRWHVKIDVRITEATESFESGRRDLSVTFGEALPTLSEYIKWR